MPSEELERSRVCCVGDMLEKFRDARQRQTPVSLPLFDKEDGFENTFDQGPKGSLAQVL